MKVIRPTKKQIEEGNRQAVAALIGIGSLLVPGGAFVGLGRKGIKSAFKKAGSIGNTKKPDTVGNRMRQSQSILGVRKDESGTRIAKHYGSKSPTSYTGGVIGTFKERKIGRTIQKAVEQGPSKFFSSGRSAKTGITPFKRAKDRFYIYGNLSTKEIKAQAKASRSTSKGSLLFENKALKKSVEDANKKARTALNKSGNNPKTGIRAGKRTFGKEQSEGYAYGYDYSRLGNSVNATKYTAYDTIKRNKNIDKALRAREELSKGLPKGQINYDPKHIREKFFQNKSLSKFDIKLAEDDYPSNIIKKARSLIKKK